MKKTGLFFVFILTLSQLLQSQNAPSAFNYSAVARDAQSNPISNQTIGIQISILKSSPTGTVVFQENHFVNTNQSGLFNLMIGTGSVLNSSIPSIDWGNDDYYIKVGMDVTGGTNFLEMGTTQLLSVPYALYAKSSGNRLIVSNTGDTLRLSGSNYVIIPGISAANSGSIGDDLDDTDDTDDTDDADDTDSNDNNTDSSTYTIPSTYNFPNADYSDQTDLLNMLGKLVSYIKSRVEDPVLDAQTLIDMYNNEGLDGSAFGMETDINGEIIGSSATSLSNKTETNARIKILELLNEIALNSGKPDAENGKAGLIQYVGENILVNDKGFEYSQLMEEGLMGSCLYYQIVSNYLSNNKIGPGVENSINETDKNYTKREHNFDAAFGYFGAPDNWNQTGTGAGYWAKMSNKINNILNTNKIFNYFIEARAAIANDVYENQVDPVNKIKAELEKIVAGTAIRWLNLCVNKTGGDRLNNLTESYAIIKALNYGNGSIHPSDVNEVLNTLGDNLWLVTDDDIIAARDLLAVKAGLESVKTQL